MTLIRLLTSVWFATVGVSPAADHQDDPGIVQLLRETQVEFTPQQKRSNITSVVFRDRLVCNAMLKQLSGLPKLRFLAIYRGRLEKVGLRYVRDMPMLEELWLSGCKKLGNRDLAALGNPLRLKVLVLEETAVTDSGLATLAQITSLEYLNLDHTEIAGDGLRSLAPLDCLQSLDLEGTRVSDKALEQMPLFPNLKTLALNDTPVTDRGIESLSRYINLEELWLRLPLTDKCMPALAKLKHLRTLVLEGKGITDAGLSHLVTLTGLEDLRLRGTSVTDEGLKYLEHMKKLKTVWLPDGITKAGIELLVKNEKLTELYFDSKRFPLDYLKKLRKRYPKSSMCMFEGDKPFLGDCPAPASPDNRTRGEGNGSQ